MNCALPWNSGVQVKYTSSAVSRCRLTTSWPKKYICACGMATPLEGPVVPEVKKIDAWTCGGGVGNSAPGRAPCASSSHGAAAQPAPVSVAIAASRLPVSTTQNFSITRAGSPTAGNFAAWTSSITAQRGAATVIWWSRKTPS